jgi:hypothetical protein
MGLIILTKEEKIKKVIEMYAQKKDVKEIAMAIGYSNPKSLSRFMSKMNYRWDARTNNYIPNDINVKTNVKPTEPKKAANISTEETQIKETLDPLDLLERSEVISLLQQSSKLLDLIDGKDKSQGTGAKSSYSLWKKAQEFAYARKASYTTSVRLPIELYEKLKEFREHTNLTQTQVVCLALDYFISRFESKVMN